MGYSQFVPSKEQIVSFNQGSGDNLDYDDYVQGYNDYLNYSILEISEEIPENLATEDDSLDIKFSDGGMYLFNNETLKPYDIKSLADGLLEYIYDEKIDNFIWLTKGAAWK